jgi:predicted GIY-YIG superfamily endonuclease
MGANATKKEPNMPSFYVYLLKCSDGSYYTGHTDNIEKRISDHMRGKCSGYTSSRLPVQVVFMQAFGSRYEALCAERKLKGWTREKKELLISGGWEALASREKK